MHQPPICFETSLFPVKLANNLHNYQLLPETLDSRQDFSDKDARDFAKKQFADSVFYKSNGEFFLLSNRKEGEKTVPFIKASKVINVKVREHPVHERVAVKRLLKTIMRGLAGLVPMNNRSFMMPFEAFYFISKKSGFKQRYFPLCKVKVAEQDSAVLLSIQVKFYQQSLLSLDQNLAEGENLSYTSKHILVSNTASTDKYYKFVEYVREFDEESKRFMESFWHESIETFAGQRLVKIESLTSGSSVVLPATLLFLIQKVKYQTFNVEKFYLCAKLVQILNTSPILSKLGFKCDQESCKPTLAYPPDNFAYYPHILPDDVNLAQWNVFCFKEDIQKVQVCLHHIVEKLQGHFKKAVNPPKCFFFDRSASHSLAQTMINGIKNKLKNQDELVFVFMNDDCNFDTCRQVREFVQGKTQRLLMMNITKYFNHASGINKKLFKFKLDANEKFVLPSSGKYVLDSIHCFMAFAVDAQKIRMKFYSTKVENRQLVFKSELHSFDSETSAIEQAVALIKTLGPANCFILKSKASHSLVAQLEIPLITAQIPVVLFKQAEVELFPDVVLAQPIKDIKINFQNFRSFLRYEVFFTDRKLETKYETQLVYLNLAEKLYLVNQTESFVLESQGKLGFEQVEIPLSLQFNNKMNAFYLFKSLAKWSANL
jgi:hypothetical protein